MKKSILSLFLLITCALTAQLDRSKEPKVGPIPEINLGVPQTFKLDNGLQVIVVENHKLPRVSYTLAIDNPPYVEGEIAGVSQLTGSLLGKGSTNIDKDTYNEEVDYMGASITFSSSGASASGLSKYADRILELLADAALNPNFTTEELEKERNILLDAIKSGEKSVATAARRVESALAYGVNHPYGEFVTQESVKRVSLEDVASNYRNYFVPKNAYLAIIGDVDFDKTKEKVIELFQLWRKASPPVITLAQPKNVQYTQINFVDMPNAVQSEIAVQNVVDLKMGDDDYFPSLLANNILGGGMRSYLNASLREDKGYTYGARSSIGADKYASRFRAGASVRNAVTDSAVTVFLDQLKRIRNEKVDPEEIEISKAEYVGEFVMALERPETIARYALNILTEDLPEDFYTTYLEKINAVTAEQIQEAAQKFIALNNFRIVVTGKGSEVAENLENIPFNGKNIPVKYFDKYTNATEKPDYSAKIPEGITANDVINKYLDALGGKEKLEGVQSYALMAEAEMQGTKLNLELKKTAKNQFMQDVKVMGNSMSRRVLDGDMGYMVMQGQRKDLREEELKKAKEESAPFPELNYLNNNVVLEGIETIEGKKAYKLKISDEKSIFYDMESGLKLQEVNTTEMQGQKMQQTLIYDDYKEVSGIKFPFKLTQSMGPQSMEFFVQEIKVNEGVSDADFE
ncbi:M16 family metallopeptidase [Ulvibacterium marinum]|uniref:Insulinase family protein n=1 Tax=Ulvibacterium marinum TaxID=2419782 RepID=A0A3B0CDW5_9FLAO|nr:pitrilysin family protein [Ulvibacterium marinum]RKN83141.1 insulinase family protein [Ulvibacterium marinum]